MKKAERKIVDKVFILLGVAATAMLLIVGALAWYGQSFASNMVKNELSAQRIFFPEANSPALKALPDSDRVEMTKFAGQQLTTGQQAKVYADNYIKPHLAKIAGGKTYSEVSTLSMKDPNNKELQAKKTSLFQGETLRGMLIGSGYAYWTFGMIAKWAAIVAFAGAGLMTVLMLLGLRHISKA